MKKNSGFTLVEMMLALGIGMVILMAVWLKFSSFRESNDVILQGDALVTLFSQGNSTYSDSIEFINDVTGTAIPVSLDRLMAATSGSLPDPIVNGMSPAGFTNIWGGLWRVSAESSTGAVQDLMVVELTNVPRQACRSLLIQVSSQMYDTTVNTQLVSLLPESATTGDNSFVWRNTLNFDQAFVTCNASVNNMKFRQLKELNLSTLRRVQPNPTTLTAEEDGTIPSSSRYRYNYQEQFNRIRTAMQSREDAQVALAP